MGDTEQSKGTASTLHPLTDTLRIVLLWMI